MLRRIWSYPRTLVTLTSLIGCLLASMMSFFWFSGFGEDVGGGYKDGALLVVRLWSLEFEIWIALVIEFGGCGRACARTMPSFCGTSSVRNKSRKSHLHQLPYIFPSSPSQFSRFLPAFFLPLWNIFLSILHILQHPSENPHLQLTFQPCNPSELGIASTFHSPRVKTHWKTPQKHIQEYTYQANKSRQSHTSVESSFFFYSQGTGHAASSTTSICASTCASICCGSSRFV
jgi:hypothetical protein